MKKNIILYTIFIFVAFMSWCICISNTKEINKFNNCVNLKYNNEQNVEQLKKIDKQKLKDSGIVNLTAYNQYSNQTVYNHNKTFTQLDIVDVYGSIENIFNFRILNGTIPNKNDDNGCIIDIQTAYKFFGTADILGLELKWNDKIYIIRGVFDCKEKIMFVQSNENTVNTIKLDFENLNNTYEQAQNFMMNYNLNGAVIDDTSPINILLCQISILPYIFIVVLIVFDLFQTYIKNQKDIKILVVVFGLLVVTILFVLNDIHLEIPQTYIPTKWSDFEFWVRTFDTIKDRNLELKNFTTLHTDIKAIKPIMLSIISCIAFGLSKKFIKQSFIKENFIYETITIAIIFISAINTSCNTRFMWAVYPLFIFVNYIKNSSVFV